MKIPHRSEGREQSPILKRTIVPGKSSGIELVRGTREGAAEIVFGLRVAARKTRTAGAQNGRDLWSGHSTAQQFLGDPFIDNAPIRLGEAFDNPQTVQPFGIDVSLPGGRHRVGVRDRRVCPLRWARPTALGGVEQSGSLRYQASMSLQHLDPRSVTVCVAPLRLLVGEAGQASQMTPIGAGQIAAVALGQLLPDQGGHGRFHRCGADVHPDLKMAGTGLEHDTGRETVGPHGIDHLGAAVIQVHQDIAGIAVLGVGLHVHVAAFAVAHAQEPQCGGMGELGRGPQALSRESSSGLIVNQTDQVELVRHGCDLAAHGPQGQIESTIEHGPNSGIEGTRRTMKSQRTANSGLTGCLSLGVHRSRPFSVPKEYGDRGYTSEAVSDAVVQFIHGNGSTVTLMQPVHPGDAAASNSDGPEDEVAEDDGILQNIDGQHVVSSFDQSTIPDIKVPLTSFTLQSLIEVLRTSIGHRPTQIAGEIVFLDERDSSVPKILDPQRTRVLIRYTIEYPEPSRSILGYHWWSRHTTTLTSTLTADSAEEAIRKLALVTADGVEERTLVDEQTESLASRYIARGNIYVGLNDYDRAARMYEQAITLQKGGSAHAYLALGVIAEREGNHKGAKDFYTRAAGIQENSDDDDVAWAQLYSANLLVREDHHPIKEAIDEYRLVLNRTPNAKSIGSTAVVQATAKNNLGFLYASMSQSKEANDYFGAANKLASKIRESARKCLYGSAPDACGASLSKNEIQSAKAESRLNINLTNQLLALSFYGLGQTELRQDKDNDSKIKQYYWQAIRANSNHAPTHYQLGKIYSKEHRYKEAIGQFQAAIQSDAGFEPAYTAWKDLVAQWPHLPEKKKIDKPLCRTLADRYKSWGESLRLAGNPDDAADRFCIAADLDPTYKGLCTISSR